MNERERIYLDYAASTPVCSEAREAMESVLDVYGNPGALHKEGLRGAEVRDEARARIAKHMGVKASELVFTSGGTEANNLALLGFFNAKEKEVADLRTLHFITTSIEHSSVLSVAEELERRGVSVTYLQPDERGMIRTESVKDALQESTVLVSVGLVNGEIGTVQPLHAISKVVKEYKKEIVLHTDAAQGMYVSLVPRGLGVQLMTLDATKMYGPRGVGLVYVERGTNLSPIMFGGGQENELRPGTENTVLYSGFAAAFNRAITTRTNESKRLEQLRDAFLKKVAVSVPEVVINGTGKQQTPHIVNVSIPDIDAEYTALYLDARGIAISTKSACREQEGSDESHVVQGLGGESWRAKNTLRFSFGSETKTADIERTVTVLKEAVEKQQSFAQKS